MNLSILLYTTLRTLLYCILYDTKDYGLENDRIQNVYSFSIVLA